MKRCISIFLAVILLSLCFSGLSAGAASAASISLKTVKNTGGTFSEITSANPNDTVTVQVYCDTAVENAGGISVTLYYDSALLEYREQSDVCHIIDEDASFMVQHIAASGGKQSRINIIWDTSTADIKLNGLLFSVSFDVLGSAENGTAVFTPVVKNLFLSDKNQTGVSISAANTASITIGTLDLSPFKALAQGIRYDDETLTNIVAAETIFKSFTSAQATAFINTYPDLYEVFSTARTTYNRLAQSAAQSEIIAEKEKFISDFADVWALEEDTENLYTYEERILLAQTTYKALSDSAKSRISASYTKKITELLDVIDIYKEDILAAEDFRTGEFAVLWSIDDATVKNTYSDLSTMISNAKITYNGMSDFAKSLVAQEYERLTEIEALIQNQIALDEAAAALQEATSAFMQRYSTVFTLNVLNVSTEDKTAIEMVISEYEKLDEDVKTALASRINNLKKLLTVIEANDKTSDNTPILKIETVTETVYVEIPGEEKIITEKVYVETQGEEKVITQTVPGETVYVQTPGQTTTVTETIQGETVTEVVTNTVKSPISKFILYISILIIFGLVMLTIPVSLLTVINKSIKKAEQRKESNG